MKFLAAHPDVGIVFRHLPLPWHVAAEPAARAAICAEQQGYFRAFHDFLFTTASWETDQDWVKVARTVSVPDLAGFSRCLLSPAAEERLRTDAELAGLLHITGTPTFVTERRIAQGMQADSSLATLLDLK
jgi:protein-disulfide isomerase